METGKFIISLDFELQWGMIDKINEQSSYRKNICKVHEILPQLLSIFRKYHVKSTFAQVGMSFFCDYQGLYEFIEKRKEETQGKKELTYENNLLNAYAHLDEVEKDDDKYFFANHLLKLIQSDKENHEIATHTFSHYYCLEPGQTIIQFEEDCRRANLIAQENDIHLESLVFPRNQINENYLSICNKYGYKVVRGNEKAWMYRASNGKENTLWKRLFRLMDAYVNLSGHNSYDVSKLKVCHDVVLLPASRFLRPYSTSLSFLEGLRLRRIKKDMTYAANRGEIFHLWWHPHNFGNNTEENFAVLVKILEHYACLNKKYGFTSATMNEFSKKNIP
ncbi:MAG: polysaccharide deacetylase family protein [Tannerellaceae bacterium]|nr:polysaccharide deacetylase family protein [Tannerellaceae bacterium]